MSTNLIIALIAICLFFSALLSGSETAITYVPREKIHQLSDSKRNNKIKKAKDDLEQTIGGILVANNFVNILMASLSTILFVNFLDGDETAGSALSTIVITLLVLVAGEITPKTIASRNPIKFLSRTAFIIDFLSRVFAPFTSLITKSIDRTSRDGDMDGDGEITEADIQALTALGEMEGQILPAEREIIDSLLDFSDRPIKEIMTPRVDVLFLSLPIEINDIKQIVDEKRISRMPVSKSESLDDTFGIVYVKDLFNLKASSDSVEVENLVKDVIYLPDTHSFIRAHILRENKASFACVIDENGGIEGVITIKDVLSEFVGDLPDEHDQRFLGIRRIGPGQWRVDGKTDIDDFEEFFGLEESDKDIATVGGLFLSHSEQLPAEGEKIIIDGLEVTVTELDNRRIESFIVKKIAKK